MFSANEQQEFLKKAQALLPEQQRWTVNADARVTPVEDKNIWQDYRMEKSDLAEFLDNTVFASGDSFMVSLPETTVGQLAFTLTSPCGYADSPSRLRITLGELPQEVIFADKPYHGTLNGSWLQTEIINIDDLPCDVVLPRRYSCKYIRFDMTGVPQTVRFSDIRIIATGSEKELLPPPQELSPELQCIDNVSVRTLRNCMHTCFEDGPKRDRRLWIGDLRLQAMVNKVTYRRFDIIARCLYLIAGTLKKDGEVCSCVMERPYPRCGCVAHDYSMIFAATLEEHCRWSGDLTIGRELFDLAVYQMKLQERFFANDLWVAVSDPYSDWFFVDHDLDLDRQASLQGIAIFAYRALEKLAVMLGRSDDAAQMRYKALKLSAVAREKLYDPKAGVVYSGPERQLSFASQIWMVLAGVLSPAEGLKALQTVEKSPEALRPSSPYMFHYLLEAWQKCGDEAHMLELLEDYYGGMVKNGADTFWEVYRPDEPMFSPYHDVRMNSACHAWSGTASYFLRKGYL